MKDVLSLCSIKHVQSFARWHLCWDLNPRSSAYEVSVLTTRLIWPVREACPIICQLAVNSASLVKSRIFHSNNRHSFLPFTRVYTVISNVFITVSYWYSRICFIVGGSNKPNVHIVISCVKCSMNMSPWYLGPLSIILRGRTLVPWAWTLLMVPTSSDWQISPTFPVFFAVFQYLLRFFCTIFTKFSLLLADKSPWLF